MLFRSQFKGQACRNEYYAFQVALFASKKEIKNVKVEFSQLTGNGITIPASSITCFNTGGIDPYGEHFIKRIDVPQGFIQPLWIGVDIGENIPAGTYQGSIIIKPENSALQTIELELKVIETVLADRGDSEPWRHSRLRWLNSTLGIDDKPVKPYDPIQFLGDNAYRLTNKVLTMDPGGMPGSIKVDDNEILTSPVSFIVESEKGVQKFSLPEEVTLLKNEPGAMSGSWKSYSDNIEITGNGIIESEGYINYKVVDRKSVV